MKLKSIAETKNKFAAVLCDIKSSRGFEPLERWKTQEKLFKAISLVNKLYDEDLRFSFEFSSGDSIQALFISSKKAFESCLFLRTLFYPYNLRFGIGIGDVNIFFLENRALLDSNLGTNFYDGYAYHLAVDALANGKLEDAEITINSGIAPYDNILNRILKISSSFNIEESSPQRKKIFFLSNLISPISSDPVFYKKILRYLDELVDIVLLGNDDIFNEGRCNISELIKDSIEKRMAFLERSSAEQGRTYTPREDLYIARILNVSEQNVAKIKNTAKFKEIRSNEIAIYDYLSAFEEKKHEY